MGSSSCYPRRARTAADSPGRRQPSESRMISSASAAAGSAVDSLFSTPERRAYPGNRGSRVRSSDDLGSIPRPFHRLWGDTAFDEPVRVAPSRRSTPPIRGLIPFRDVWDPARRQFPTSTRHRARPTHPGGNS